MGVKDPKSYYAILGVPTNASASDIKAAFRRKATELHPDRNKATDATRQFQLLNEAYGVLSDPNSRAQYDTNTIDEADGQTTPGSQAPEPVVCSECNCTTAQPRYAIFYQVMSFLFVTYRIPIQGIFCRTCFDKKMLKATICNWLLGWWAPWGFLYTIGAVIGNLFAGAQQHAINARILMHQAWYFAYYDNITLARAITLDALDIAAKIRPASDIEGIRLRKMAEDFIHATDLNGPVNRLKNSWKFFGKSFFVQIAIALVAVAGVWYLFNEDAKQSNSGSNTASTSARPFVQSKPYEANPVAVKSMSPAYERPETAPNGSPWPVGGGYVKGYKRLHTKGISMVTIDNGQNDNDVFVKLVSVSGTKSYPVRTFYIPPHGSFTVKNVASGEYDVRYKNLVSGGLSKSEPFSLEEIPSETGRQYSKITMTLYKVRDGNMKTYDLSDDEF